MDNKNSDKDYKQDRNSNMTSGTSRSDIDEKSTSGPTVLLLWIWNWFATLPKTMSNLYADLKNGDLLSRFTLIDAMLQFIFAVATSCHPQEESPSDMDEYKVNGESPNSSKDKEIKAFGGAGRSLRSRTVAAS